jgi:hypothetical protein
LFSINHGRRRWAMDKSQYSNSKYQANRKL